MESHNAAKCESNKKFHELIIARILKLSLSLLYRIPTIEDGSYHYWMAVNWLNSWMLDAISLCSMY